jgi:hypothetical protein
MIRYPINGLPQDFMKPEKKTFLFYSIIEIINPVISVIVWTQSLAAQSLAAQSLAAQSLAAQSLVAQSLAA